MPGALSILVALGFREEENGSLALTPEASLVDLDARRLELEVGLSLLRARVRETPAASEKAGSEKGSASEKYPSKMLPPRSTTAANVTAELAVHTAARTDRDRDEDKSPARSPLKKRTDHNIEEERLKRQRAETALVHQESLVQDLQSQLSELQDMEQRNFSLRQGLTISRLDHHEKNEIQKDAAALGRDSFAFHDPDTAPDAKTKLPNSKALPGDKGSSGGDKKRSVNGAESKGGMLTQPAVPGDTRLRIAHTEGYKKGMYLLIGSGTAIECHRVSGFGGETQIEKPLTHPHPAGSPVRAFPAIPQSLVRIDRITAEENIRGLILDEIVSKAVALGSQNLLKRELDVLYARRPMMKHVCTLEKHPAVHTGNPSTGSAMSASADSQNGRLFVLSDGGGLSSVDFSLGMVDTINLFEDNVFGRPVPAGAESMCSVLGLVAQIEGNAHLRGGMQQIAQGRGFPSFQSLLNGLIDREDRDLLPWSSFCAFIRPSCILLPIPMSSADRETLQSKYDADSLCVDLLGKLFRLLDSDDDGNMSTAEAKSAFAQIDGHFSDQKAFALAMARVMGTHTDEHRLCPVAFMTVRAEYASIVSTLPGGLLLCGRHTVGKMVDSIAQGGDRGSPVMRAVDVGDLIAELPSQLLNCLLLSSGRSLSAVLAGLPTPLPRYAILKALSDRSLLGSSPHREEPVETEGAEIAHVATSSTAQTLYLLSRDGVVHVFDVNSSAVMMRRRVIWAEPFPQRAVEGSERFLKWQRTSGLDYCEEQGDSQEVVAAMRAKAEDTHRTSLLLASFVLSLPTRDAVPGVTSAGIAVDAESGLLAVNCSASSGSICILEPSTLQRIYRVKSPGRPCKDLSDAVQGICLGETSRGRPAQHMCVGTVNQMVLWATRSLLLCSLWGSNDLNIVSLLTGDTVTTLSGHTDSLSCIHVSHPLGLIFTGAADCMVRVWLADECVPHSLAALGAFDDASLYALESKVAHSSTVSGGARQAIRALSSKLCMKLGPTPHWRRGRIVSFFDGQQHSAEPLIERHSVGVEVVFEDGSVQLYANRALLRHPKESLLAPRGPPLWSEPEAPMALHQEVAVYEVDPAVLACECGRAMGVSHTAALPFSQVKRLLDELLGLGSDSGDLENTLVCMGLEERSSLSLLGLTKRIYKHSEKTASQCDRLLVSNSAPITAITLCSTSKLLVTIDVDGGCCVWDPCQHRVSLTVSSPFGRPAFIGLYPYALVHRSNLLQGMACSSDSGSSNSNGKSRAVRPFVAGINMLSVPSSMAPPYPMDRETLTKALSLDAVFSPEEVTARGFIFVMRDLSATCVSTSCFLPALVAMDCPEQFLFCPRMDGSQAHGRVLTTLQQLYVNRESVLRVVYTVSCAHETLEALADDLRQYGVLQRGYSSTPSESIEVVCFERPKGWLEQNKDPANTATAVATTAETALRTSMGVLIAVTADHLLRIAMDFSNDVVCIHPSQVQSVWDARSDSHIERTNKSGLLNPGSRVIFSVDSTVGNPSQLDRRPSSEMLIVCVRGVGEGGLHSALLPLVLGRSSYPLPAGEIDLPECQDTKASLSRSIRQISHAAFGRLSADAFSRRSARARWSEAFRIFQSRVWDAVSSRSFEPSALHDMRVVSAFSGLDVTAMPFAVDLFVSLSVLRVSASHPLLVYLDGMLGGRGQALFEAVDRSESRVEGTWRESLQDLQAAALTRQGLQPHELCREARSIGLEHLESFMFALSAVVARRPFSRVSALTLGAVDSSAISASLGGTMEAIRGGEESGVLAAAKHDTDALVARLKASVGTSVLRTYLIQHRLSCIVAQHLTAMRSVNCNAMKVLLQHLSALTQPVLIAAKDCPLLPAPTFEKIFRNFPTKRKSPPEGKYAIISRSTYGPLISGLKVEIVKAIKPHDTGNDDTHSFMTWSFTGRWESEEEGDSSLLEAISKLSALMLPIQQDSAIPIRSLQGVTFIGDDGDHPGGTTLEWDEGWQPLRALLAKQKGLFRVGLVDLFRTQAVRILDSIIELSDRGVVMRSLSPDTIIIDESGTKVRLLVLPTAVDIDQLNDHRSACNESVLHSYVDCCNEDPLRAACVPHFGLQEGSKTDLSGFNCDAWSFGSVLFMLAFGVSPLGSQSGTAASDVYQAVSPDPSDAPSSAASALLALMMSAAKDLSRDINLGSSGVQGRESEEARELKMAETLDRALGDDRQLLLQLLQRVTGQSTSTLTSFHAAFILELSACGLSDRAAGLQWERMTQALFFRLCGGPSSLQAMRTRLAKLPKDLSLTPAHAFATEHLGLTLTAQEFVGLVKSLSPEMTHKQKPFTECSKIMFKSLSGMLEEVQWYGMFQQLLYLFSRCLNADPFQRPQLREIRRMAIFGLTEDEPTVGRVAREARLQMARYASSEAMHSSALLAPLSKELLALMAHTRNECQGSQQGLAETGYREASMHSSLETVSSLMGCVEELVSLAVKQANSHSDPATNENDALGMSLGNLGVEFSWMNARAVEVLLLAMESNIIPGLALYVIRFLSAEAAQKSSDVRLLSGMETESERETKGLSIGSRLVMRMAKFLQHMTVCLNSLSRTVGLPAAVNTYSQFSDADGDAHLAPFQSILEMRKMSEQLFHSSLTAALMLYTGEEAPIAVQGPYHTTLLHAHPGLFAPTAAHNVDRLNAAGVWETMESRFSAHTCKLFEPVLLDLVGEDGRGSNRMPLSGECLQHTERIVDSLLTRTPSADTAMREISELGATRGSAYFTGLFKVFRALYVEEAASGKAKEKAHSAVVAAVALSLPVAALQSALALDDGKKGAERRQVIPVAADSPTWQRLQMLLDTRASARLSYCFYSSELGLHASLLRVCQRALGTCLQVPAESGQREPFASVGMQFSAEGWLYGISEILRVKVENPDIAVAAIECLRLMAHKREWMRCWAAFDVLPILCYLNRAAGKNLGAMRADVKATLRLSALNRPEGARAMLEMRLPHAGEIPGVAGPGPISALIAEATDLGFGSTLAEQAQFTQALSEWVTASFPSEIPSKGEGHAVSGPGSVPWEQLLGLVESVSSWIPKLCITLQIHDAHSAPKKERTALSVDVACKQIAAVGRVLLYAVTSGYSGATSSAISCIWAPPDTAESAFVLGSADSSGLLGCLDQLAAAGTQMDPFLSLKLQCQIMRTLCRLIQYGSVELMHSLLDCGLMHSISRFLQGVVDTVSGAVKLNQVTDLTRDYRSIFHTVCSAWETVMSMKDEKVVEELMDSGIMQRIADQWLPCPQSIALSGSVDHETNPLLVRSLALRLMRGVLTRTGTDGASSRLSEELCRWLSISGAVGRELQILQTVTAPVGKGNAKAAAANARRTAAEVLCAMAWTGCERLDDEMKVQYDAI
jgi:serine/threonine protein kinase